MKNALKKSRFYIGISLIVQCLSMILIFFTQWRKSRSIAVAVLAVAAVSGAVGGYLVALGAKDEEEKNEMLEALREDFFEISDDDLAEEEDAIYCVSEDAEDIDFDEDFDEE